MIRKYKEVEIPTLIIIWERATKIAHPFLKKDFSQMVKTAMIDQYLPNSETYVYEENKVILGFISMLDNEIGGLFVCPDNQGKGIGSALVKHVGLRSKELEVEVFDKNEIGKPFYLKQGFIVVKDYFHELSNEKVLRMKKT